MTTGTRACRLIALALLPALATLGLGGCGTSPDPDAVIRVAIGEPHHLLPTNVNDPDGSQVIAALFTPLVDFDDAGRPYPVAAAAIDGSPDSRVWTVTLRNGFTFHDGEPVTADNYVAAWNYGAYQPNDQRNNHLFTRIEGYGDLNPPAGDPPAAQTLSGLAVVDDQTFTVTLAEPFSSFPATLGATAFHPLPAAAFAEPGVLRPDFETAPIGNGPFRIAGGWERGERIALERYDRYPGEPARAGRIEFLIYEDTTEAYRDLLTGAVHVLPRIPPAHLAGAPDQLGERYLRGPAPVFQFLAVPSYQEELADPAVRHAISMAIDRDEIVEAVFHHAQSPARGFVAPLAPGAQAGSCGPACRHDPVAARDLYAGAGGPDRLTITYNADGGHARWVEATCAQLAAHLGIECAAQAEPNLPDLLARVDAQEQVGLVRLGWTVDYPAIEAYLEPVFATTGSANFSGYQNPAFDQLLAAAAAAETEAEALAAYHRAEAILAEDLPVIPLRFGYHHAGHSPEVREVRVSRLGPVDLTRIEVLP